jgi:hypothetical protein
MAQQNYRSPIQMKITIRQIHEKPLPLKGFLNLGCSDWCLKGKMCEKSFLEMVLGTRHVSPWPKMGFG